MASFTSQQRKKVEIHLSNVLSSIQEVLYDLVQQLNYQENTDHNLKLLVLIVNVCTVQQELIYHRQALLELLGPIEIQRQEAVA